MPRSKSRPPSRPLSRLVKLVLRPVLVMLVIVAALLVWKHEEVARLMAVNRLFDESRIVGNFSNMDGIFLTRTMSRGGVAPGPLPPGPPATLPPEVAHWAGDRTVTALIVLKDGRIVAEEYFHGTGPDDRRISWSVAKSWLSALFGILHAEGAIPSLDAPVTEYVPELVGSAYEGATIRHVLNMASGVAFNEDYLDFNSDINRMGRVLALGSSMDGFAAGQNTRRGDPGADWQYVSIDTHVLGMVIRAATGRSIPDLMEERLIRPLGLEADPYYIIDGHGTAFVLGGLNLTARDYARFAQMIAQGGAWQGRQVVPSGWIDESTRASAPGGAGYGYQWWVPEDAAEGEFFARGIYGQYAWIDRARNVVIVVAAADRGFDGAGVHSGNIELFRTIAQGLDAP
ncbi:MAG: serine hydrolase [Gemmobacter sp.]